MICEIRNMGVTVSLDDFGTGYSSLSYLKNLPLDELKIDQSFVRDLLDDPSDAAIAETILALASSLGMRALAEGVETAGQLRRLKAMGCQFFRGFCLPDLCPQRSWTLMSPINSVLDDGLCRRPAMLQESW